MGDNYMEKMEAKFANLTSGQQTMFQLMQDMMAKQMQEMMAAMNTRMDQMTSNRNDDHGESSHRRNDAESLRGRTNYDSMGSGGTLIPKVTKLDFPRFNGSDNPTNWICQAEQFFSFQNISQEKRLQLSAYHLEVRLNFGINY
jgi:hypothetical protein